jgi:UDP-galactopyranose mutase
MKIRPVGAELFHADRHTDMTLIIAFREFANVPKKGTPYVTTTYVLLSVNLTQYQQLIRQSDSVKRKMKTMTCMIRIPSHYNTQGSER